MTLPRSLRIGYRDISVCALERHVVDSDTRFGDYDSNYDMIRVSTDFGPVRTLNVLLHETLHAAYEAAHLADEDTEERVVAGLADVLTQVFRDNPALLEFVAESVGVCGVTAIPDWVAEFLNRRTEVEGVLRRVGAGKREPLTPEECRELANKLSVPSEFMSKERA